MKLKDKMFHLGKGSNMLSEAFIRPGKDSCNLLKYKNLIKTRN